jgi:hypothetical protein
VRLLDVRGSNPETGKPIFSLDQLEVIRGHDRLLIRTDRVDVEEREFDCVSKALQNRFLMIGGPLPKSLRIVVDEVGLSGSSRLSSIYDMRAELEAIETGRRATIQFRLARAAAASPAQIRVFRDRRHGSPITRLDLDTDTMPLPSSLVSSLLSRDIQLGSRAQFRGKAWAKLNSSGWEAELTGHLTDVDLGEVITRRFPHKLDGTAHLEVLKAVVRGSRLVEAEGVISAGPGVLSHSLLAAAADNMHLVSQFKSDASADRVDVNYERLASRFVIDAQGLTIFGICESGPTGTLITGESGVMLRQTTRGPQPVINLVRALVPQRDLQAPLTQETEMLIGFLPLPRAAAQR